MSSASFIPGKALRDSFLLGSSHCDFGMRVRSFMNLFLQDGMTSNGGLIPWSGACGSSCHGLGPL